MSDGWNWIAFVAVVLFFVHCAVQSFEQWREERLTGQDDPTQL